MKPIIKIDLATGKIRYNREFETKASIPGSPEYNKLVECRQQFPEFSIERRTIKTNPHKETYEGLTYDYIERYICTHESDEERDSIINEFNELRLISECHRKGKRYPTIKKWFLEKYPDVAKFGIPKEEAAENDSGNTLSQKFELKVAS